MTMIDSYRIKRSKKYVEFYLKVKTIDGEEIIPKVFELITHILTSKHDSRQ